MLPILHYPDERLRQVAAPVTAFDNALAKLVDDMAETMYAAPGVGLAATQVGVPQRVFIVDIGEEEASGDLRVFVNPEIEHFDGETAWEEGCLSFPGIRESIQRAERVRVSARDVRGDRFTIDAEGLLAIAIQHENDHLNGKLMVDRVGMLRKRLIHRSMTRGSHSS